MSEQDKTITYRIETVDNTDNGFNEVKNNIKTADNHLKAMAASSKKLGDTQAAAHNKISKSLSEQLGYGRKLNEQVKELAFKFIGLGAAVAVVNALKNSVIDAGLQTEELNKNMGRMSATIGAEFLPIAQKGVDWFNTNYKTITKYTLDFIRSIEIGFKGLATVPLTIAYMFYDIKSKLPGSKQGKAEAKRFADAYNNEIRDSLKELGGIVEKIKAPASAIEMQEKVAKPNGKKAEKDKSGDLYKQSLQGMIDYQARVKQINADLVADAAAKGEEWKANKLKEAETLATLQAATIESGLAAIEDESERELAILDIKHQRELALYEKVNGAKYEIDAQYDMAKADLEIKSAARAKSIAEKEKLMKLNNFQQVGGAFSALMSAIGDATKENAKAQKAVAIVQAVINTALGVTQAIAQGGVAGIVTGALVAAAGAIQIGTIASQNFAIGGYARRVPGAVSDKVPINVNPDEAIVTKRQQNNLTRFLNNPDTGSKGDTYNIYDYTGNLIETIQTMINSGRADRLNRTLNSRYAMA